MPIREYSCTKCGHVFENIEIDATTGDVVCPKCESREVQHVFSIFSSAGANEASCDTSSRFT